MGTVPLRLLWLGVALGAIAAGAVGVVVPVLPTTPFLLVGAYAAARSSPRLHHWLLSHRIFGPFVRDWQAERAVSRRTKLTAFTTMAVSAVVLFFFSPSPWLAGGVTAFMTAVAAWLWTRPEPRTAGLGRPCAGGSGTRVTRR